LLFQDSSRQNNKSKNNTNLTSQDQWWADPLLKTIENDMADPNVKEELSGDEMEELQSQDNFEIGGSGSPKCSDSCQRGLPKNVVRTQQSTANVSLKPRSTIKRYFASSIVVVLRKPRTVLRQRRLTQAKLIQNVRIRAIAVATKLKSKERGVIRKETRATKLVLIVMCAFLLCYLPFFTTNVVKIFKLWSNTWNDRWEHLFIVFTWLGYSNSCLNPIIYSIFNKKFRQTFFKTFGFWRRSDEEKISSGAGRRCRRRHGRQRQLLTTTIFSPNNVTTLKSYLPRVENTTKFSSDEKRNSSVKIESEQKLLVVDEEPKSVVIDTRNQKRGIPVSVSFLEPNWATSSPENIVKSLPDLHNLNTNIRDEGHILRQDLPIPVATNDISDNFHYLESLQERQTMGLGLSLIASCNSHYYCDIFLHQIHCRLALPVFSPHSIVRNTIPSSDLQTHTSDFNDFLEADKASRDVDAKWPAHSWHSPSNYHNFGKYSNDNWQVPPNVPHWYNQPDGGVILRGTAGFLTPYIYGPINSGGGFAGIQFDKNRLAPTVPPIPKFSRF
uniref:G-protein coupled receptors family 1 profile domain-containing protein n=1 Tax=Romanomermis culicivorax TaxID=13658 RepID=A0A915L3S7_ROMCU